jgi:KUP system potassium uptake protein
MPLGVFLAEHESRSPLRIAGTAYYMSGNPGITPPALLHNLRHNKVLHERVVILNVRTEDVPHVPPEDRLSVDCLALGFWRIALRFGFMDEPDVPRELQRISGGFLEGNLLSTGTRRQAPDDCGRGAQERRSHRR